MKKNDFKQMAENAEEMAKGYAITSAEAGKSFLLLGKIMADYYERYGWMFHAEKKNSALEKIKTWMRGLLGRGEK